MPATAKPRMLSSATLSIGATGRGPMDQASQQVGSVVRQLRGQRGWSLRALAARAGISSTHLSRIERLDASPTEETVRGLAAALDVPVSVLFGEVPHGEDVEAVVTSGVFTSAVRQFLADSHVPPAKRSDAERLIVATARAICANFQEGTSDAAPNHSTRDHR
jgi:transcriptional regulator with XRE-family HTH domain